jgi:eukaryotic-like serine/threonine-protein kinase
VIHALGETPDGRKYIAMEYVEGRTLRDRLASGPLAVHEAVGMAGQLATGLAAAHASQVVHRDLKPENVIVRPDGLVKILDFGLAKLALDGRSEDNGITQSMPQTDPGTVLGTVLYMSPEQARGQDVDARTDLWALGVILYELVTGRVPFKGPSSSDIIAAILDRDPPPLARVDTAVPAELQRIVTKVLRKDREQRYQTAKDLALDLQALHEDLRSQSRPSALDVSPGDPPRSAACSDSTSAVERGVPADQPGSPQGRTGPRLGGRRRCSGHRPLVGVAQRRRDANACCGLGRASQSHAPDVR